MFSRTFALLAIAAATIVKAQMIKPGLYSIQSADDAIGFACPQNPFNGPPGQPAANDRVVVTDKNCHEFWEVTTLIGQGPPVSIIRVNGQFRGMEYTHSKDEAVALSGNQISPWEIHPAGPDSYVILEPRYEDSNGPPRAWTGSSGDSSPVKLQSISQESKGQVWKLVKRN